jgi:hypothetical protein
VAQGVGPEFKPQYGKKKKTQKIRRKGLFWLTFSEVSVHGLDPTVFGPMARQYIMAGSM